jgi:glycosyltransferase involved in cell wall biosynthesis
MPNIHLHNVDLTSNSGPNTFGQKLFRTMKEMEVEFNSFKDPDATLAFIQSIKTPETGPLFQRLDGIYFNIDQDYNTLNRPILETYKRSNGVIFQSNFNKRLITKFFGEHENSVVIHNGSEIDLIDKIPQNVANISDKYDNIWCCAAHWRPHKRLNSNIQYFLEKAGKNDILFVAGSTSDQVYNDPRIKYVGNIKYETLLTILKSSDYFLHLAWLDHCPNVVVDARASGCRIICTSSGGTKEIAGKNAIIIKEQEWTLEPVKLYEPPKLDFNKIVTNDYDSDYDMKSVARKYLNFMLEKK